jgi:hypothetical protein
VACTLGRVEVAGKGVGGLIRCKKCVHMYVNVKMVPIETVTGIVEREMETREGGEFKYDIFDTL